MQLVEHSLDRPSASSTSSTGVTFLANVRKVFSRLREFNVAFNPKKTTLGLDVVAYVGHVVSSTLFLLEYR